MPVLLSRMSSGLKKQAFDRGDPRLSRDFFNQRALYIVENVVVGIGAAEAGFEWHESKPAVELICREIGCWPEHVLASTFDLSALTVVNDPLCCQLQKSWLAPAAKRKFPD